MATARFRPEASLMAFLAVFVLALLQFGTADARSVTSPRAAAQAPIRDGHWVDIWTSMPQLVEPGNLPPAPFNDTPALFANVTLRQTVQLSLPSTHLRLRISNVFGLTDLSLTGVTIALPANGSAGQSAIDVRTTRTVTFDQGHPGITIAKGALAVSDAVQFDVGRAQMEVAVTMYFAQGQLGGAITGHPGSRTTSWLARGDLTAAGNVSEMGTAHWYFLSAIESWLPSSHRTFAILGDSITDGRGSTTDANNRWPDQLLQRLQSQRTSPSLRTISIANQAAGGNRLLADGLGPNVLSRIERDVLAQPGVRYVAVFAGVNDIGTASTDAASQQKVGDAVVRAYAQIVTKCHAAGLPVFGATITPFSGNASVQPYSDPERERTRQRVNAWIRESARFDEVLDFDRVLRSRQNPAMLDPRFDSGDFLHPNPQGYEALAKAFPVGIFEDYEDGVDGFV